MRYTEYNPETLKRLQKIEVDMLKDFNELCEKHDIDYFAIAGTAIGAVRHKGFVPWDDDIDIGMTRENYEKFLKIAKKEYSDKYDVLNAETNEHYPLMTTMWSKKGTKFVVEYFKDLDVEFGVFLDIQCFDNIPDDENKMRSQARRAWIWGKILILRNIKRPVLYVDGFKSKIIYAICYMVHYALKLFHITPKFIYNQAKKAATQYNNEDTNRLAFFYDTQLYTSIIEKNIIEPTVWTEFEGSKIKIPNDVHNFLSQRYGDYMQLPPEDKRHNHPPYELNLGE